LHSHRLRIARHVVDRNAQRFYDEGGDFRPSANMGPAGRSARDKSPTPSSMPRPLDASCLRFSRARGNDIASSRNPARPDSDTFARTVAEYNAASPRRHVLTTR
jgi:hypothetical protein